MSQEDIGSWGTVYTGGDGKKYVLLPNMSVGVRADACGPFRGTVESVERPAEGSLWWALTLREFPARVFHLHNNRVIEVGTLTPGESVEGVMDSLHGDRFWLLRRKQSETSEAAT